MSQKTTEIETTAREAEAITTREKYLVVIQLGRGAQHRQEFEGAEFTQHQKAIEGLAKERGRGAVVYASGIVNGEELVGLFATYIPATDKWKFSELA